MPSPVDLFAKLVESIATPLNEWLVSQGAEPQVALGPPTREGAGDLALPCHRYARVFRKAPQQIACDLAAVASAHPLVSIAEPVAGFLNLHFDWAAVANEVVPWALSDDGALGRSQALAGRKVLIEYSAPNTNKPQHLGHCRNNILGVTVATLMRAAGADVVRVNLINDRGIHICKSMVAYRRFGEGVTPESMGQKGDHFVGDFYVRFDQAFQEEFLRRPDPDVGEDDFFNTVSALGREAREMLQAWEAGDPEVRALWTRMNGWCTDGFDQTYARMGVEFDRTYLESETYLLGKRLVEQGLEAGVFTQAPGGPVLFDLAKIELEGQKVVLRADGTSVYTTQDLGTAITRHDEYQFDKMYYVVADEQEHHFKVLFGILEHLRPELKERLVHLSYGMVKLPSGNMKSRKGTVVDADDLMDELSEAAAAEAGERSPELSADERRRRGEAIGQGGLKYFLLKYAPETTFVFDPQKSIAIEGETGAYCQYAYARASSILRKLGDTCDAETPDYTRLVLPQERAVMTAMLGFPGEVRAAAQEAKPSYLTRSTFELAKAFATFFNHPEARVLAAPPGLRAARADLVRGVRRMLAGGMALMGIVPLEEM